MDPILSGGGLGEAGRVLLGLVESGALASARAYGFVLVFPLFAWLGVTGVLQAAIAIGLSIPLIQPLFAQIGAPEQMIAGGGLPTPFLAMLVAKEIAVGAAIGLVLGAPFWAAAVGGAYVDYYRGAIMATVNTARPDGDVLTTGAAIQLALLALFVATGGVRAVLDVLYASYGPWPALSAAPPSLAALPPFALRLLGEMFLLAVALAAPLLITMALAEAALAFSSRLAPRLNVFDTTLSVKSLALLTILPLYFYAFTAQYVSVPPSPQEIGARLLEAARSEQTRGDPAGGAEP